MLAGACMSAVGTVSGAGAEGLGVVWLDAHADFDTPEDNLSGFFDVMALAVLTGAGWKALRETVPGFAPVPEERVVVAGVRDLEPYQRARLGRSAVRTVPGAFTAEDLAAALDELRERVGRVYLHVDLDVLDSRAGRANEYAAPGGPGPDTVVGAVDAVFDRFAVAAAALTAYDPTEDANGRAREVGRRVIARIRERAAAASEPARKGGAAPAHRAPPSPAAARPGPPRLSHSDSGALPGSGAAASPRASPARSSRSRSADSSSGDGSHCAGSGSSSSERRPNSFRKSGVVR